MNPDVAPSRPPRDEGLKTPDRLRLGRRRLRRVVFSEEAIRERVAELGREIAAWYGPDADVLVLGLLKGSFIFVADLVRQIRMPIQVDFLRVSSYENRRVSNGEIRLWYNPGASLENRNVVLVEDIIDSGNTIKRVIPMLMERNPASLELCTLLHKRLVRLPKEPRWVGFDAPEEFLIGYGLDFAEDYRHLPYIGSI